MQPKPSRLAVPVILSLTLALYACGPAQPEPSAGALVLWENGPTGHSIAVADAATGAVGARLPYGALDRGRSLLYAAVPSADGASTAVQVYALPRGDIVRSTSLTGNFALPDQGALSTDGRFLVLQERSGHQPGGDYEFEASTFAVLETAVLTGPRVVTLRGRFEVDALSPGGDDLYLIEYLSPAGSGNYRVRVYDLTSRQLVPQAVAEGLDRVKQVVPTMTGTVLQQIVSPEGKWVYSLYLNREKGPFVHALNTAARESYCIFLPTDHKEDLVRQTFWALALSYDGTRLYAANGALGIVHEHKTGSRSNRTGRFDTLIDQDGLKSSQAPPVADPSTGRIAPTFGATLSPGDGSLYVLGTRGVHIVDVESLQPQRFLLAGRAVRSMSLSRDGSVLYVITRDTKPRILALEASSGNKVRTLTRGGINALAVLTSM